MSEWGTTPAERLSAYAQRWEKIAAERGVRMDELQARAEVAEAEIERLREALGLANEIADAYGRHFAKDERYYAFRDALKTLEVPEQTNAR